ncbi:trans-aconitate 2-methyltransferase [Gandjariella thermophila]|uniref:Trans-aconitate 2-methyltransferase n=1 Tax=Gandjariella thermophila TaxID=1931992 RepID=A0A4D4JBZ2_9PSEU|nr:trans-aconitate 2-methyltransferase [Gandjariella thermophila]GDY31383.1 trans-aconitate 2-methyltransferase [Gandjariella thermophila]
MWDPSTYLRFADQRARPFHELLARIDAPAPRHVVDLGCGAGNLTALLAERWPKARLTALDSSPDMVAAARELGIDAEVADLRSWHPDPDTDVVISNAVLQWVPGHQELLAGWAGALPPGAWLAIQVPGNFHAASHALTRELAASPEWSAELASAVLRDPDPVLDPEGYANLLADAGCEVDAWETTYLQRLSGDDPVLRWISGTALRPVRAALDDRRWERFQSELAPRLRAAYPPRADGTTWFPFRRVFVVARVT